MCFELRVRESMVWVAFFTPSFLTEAFCFISAVTSNHLTPVSAPIGEGTACSVMWIVTWKKNNSLSNENKKLQLEKLIGIPIIFILDQICQQNSSVFLLFF